MAKRLLVTLAVCMGLALFSIPLAASSLPVVKQPNGPSLSAADRAAIVSALSAIEASLKTSFSPAEYAHVGGLSWSDADSVQFAAGTLQGAGFSVLLASGPWTGGTRRTWILVGVPVSFGLTYVPVEAVPSLLPTSAVLGAIAWQDGATGSTFDARYLNYDQATALSPNAPPTASAAVTDEFVVVNATATLLVSANDPDDAILLYVWTFDDGTQVFDTRPVLWHAFPTVGQTTVNLDVIDARGARTHVSVRVDVRLTAPNCNCGAHGGP